MSFKKEFELLCKAYNSSTKTTCMLTVDDIPESDIEAESCVENHNVLFNYSVSDGIVKGTAYDDENISFKVIDQWLIDGIQWFKIDN